MHRKSLPQRRPNAAIATDWNGHSISVTVGYWPDGTPGEVFADTTRGGDMQATIADCCVIISIALQHGVTLAALGKSLGRVPDVINGQDAPDLPASPIGAIVEAMAKVATE